MSDQATTAVDVVIDAIGASRMIETGTAAREVLNYIDGGWVPSSGEHVREPRPGDR